MSKKTDALSAYLAGSNVEKDAVTALWDNVSRTFRATADMVASTDLTVGEIVQVADGSNWEVVAAGTGTADGVNYIDLDTHQAQIINSSAGFQLADDTTPELGGPLDTNGHPVDFSQGADVATAMEALVLRDGNSFVFTGTTTVATIENTADAWPIGSVIRVRAAGIFTMTHSASLSLKGSADITTAVDDVFWLEKYAAGSWRMLDYSRADGTALVAPSSGGWEPWDGGADSLIYEYTSGDTFDTIELGIFSDDYDYMVEAYCLGDVWSRACALEVLPIGEVVWRRSTLSKNIGPSRPSIFNVKFPTPRKPRNVHNFSHEGVLSWVGAPYQSNNGYNNVKYSDIFSFGAGASSVKNGIQKARLKVTAGHFAEAETAGVSGEKAKTEIRMWRQKRTG